MSGWDDFFGRKFKGLFGGEGPPGAVAPRAPFRLFKDNCLTLPWVREKQEIDSSIQGARADLLRSWNVYREGLKSSRSTARAEDDWRQVLGAFRRNVADLNRRIAAYNLRAPSDAFRHRPLDPEREINNITRER